MDLRSWLLRQLMAEAPTDKHFDSQLSGTVDATHTDEIGRSDAKSNLAMSLRATET